MAMVLMSYVGLILFLMFGIVRFVVLLNKGVAGGGDVRVVFLYGKYEDGGLSSGFGWSRHLGLIGIVCELN